MTAELPTLLAGGIALLALLLGLWQLQVSRKLRGELAQLRQQLAEQRQPTPVATERSSFSARLDQAERSQPQPAAPRNTAEKYRYVASLAEQGVDAAGIASALQMAPAEVEQLLRLASLKQRS